MTNEGGRRIPICRRKITSGVKWAVHANISKATSNSRILILVLANSQNSNTYMYVLYVSKIQN